MHLFQPQYIVKAKRDKFLHAETASGRSLLLFVIALFLILFQEYYIAYFGVVVLFLFWTHSTEWIIDGNTEKVLRRRIILYVAYDETELSIGDIKSVSVARRGNAGAVGDNYTLTFLMSDGKTYNIATRGQVQYLKPIIADLRRVLPPVVSFQVDSI